MFSLSAHWYDLIYSFKDYGTEAETIHVLIQELCPGARTLLDAACGSAEHHRYLKQWYRIAGFDLDPAFVEASQIKNPECRYFEADMRTLSSAEKYDVVTCLFSSIGYARNREATVQTLRALASCVRPGGLLLIEPWMLPGQWTAGRQSLISRDMPGVKIVRMSETDLQGDISIIHMHYLIAEPGKSVLHGKETHELLLLSREEMQECFQKAGLVASFREPGLSGRGIYTAIVK